MSEKDRQLSAWLIGMLMITISCLVASCAQPPPVYVPNEWRGAPPPQPAAPPPSAQQQMPEPEVRTGGATLQPMPQFREKDVAVSPPQAPSAPVPEKKVEPPRPQQVASMSLVDQGRTALSQGKPDAAIPPLEQAVHVDVYNGDAFFHLARAWKMKGSRQKALEFAKKAEVLFQEDRKKLKSVYQLESDIYREMKDTGKAEQYREKASRL